MESHDDLSASDYLRLADFERTLRSDVRKPYGRVVHKDLDQSCVDLPHKMQHYQRFAALAYKSDPEHLSLMLITLLEIWRAIDSIALMLYPLLADYEPEFPRDILHPLHAAQLSDLRRVQDIENYLERRRTVAKPTCPSIFRDVLLQSFAVRYFDQSEEIQQLAAKIEAANERAKAQKEEEWTQKCFEYEAVMKQAAETTCPFHRGRV